MNTITKYFVKFSDTGENRAHCESVLLDKSVTR